MHTFIVYKAEASPHPDVEQGNVLINMSLSSKVRFSSTN